MCWSLGIKSQALRVKAVALRYMFTKKGAGGTESDERLNSQLRYDSY